MNTIAEIFRPEELRTARTEAIDETLKEMRTFARKAPDPAKRIALSELEKLLRDTRALWVTAGLVNPEPEGARGDAAMAA
ncbi:MAG TPA: hypothetical protein PK490_14990 [Prosthecobacter sp.]|nr:hypothetical protein [Prosthecobacter sp.]HRK15584.1 hypothetical protein [Prosthecobacter sp.]